MQLRGGTPLAERTTQWERGNDPMTQFTFTDDYDLYGQPRSQISIAVPRGRDFRVAAPGEPYLATQVVTQYARGTLHTIGADSVPDFSVNAHEYPRPLGGQGVLGFVNNGHLGATAEQTRSSGGPAATSPGSRPPPP